MAFMKAELYHKIDCELGEGPVWDHRRQELLWVDVNKMSLFFLDDKTKELEIHTFDQMVSFAVPCPEDCYILGMQQGLFQYRRQTRQLTLIFNPEKDLPNNRFNDGKCDLFGNIWAGTMDLNQRPGLGSLYKLDRHKKVTKQHHPVSISNGLAWNEELKRMYYIDSPNRSITTWHYENNTHQLGKPINVFHTPKEMGYPDGMTIDHEGMLWIAHWDGECVARWHPELGQLITKVEIPAPRVTSCIFGANEMTTLYITTARIGLTKEQLQIYPLSGSVFCIDTNTKGNKIEIYKGASSYTPN